MVHKYFRGAHYEIGRRFGAALAKHGQFLLDNVPYPITQEREAFALSCLPAYQKFFPEILEEIRGLAEGQHCAPEKLQTVLFSMYAIPPACGCSCFAVSDGEHILLGRNSDFSPELEKLNMNVIYRFSDSSCSFTGNTTAYIEMEDGVNEHGLAVGLTFVPPVSVKPGLNAGLLLRLFLEKCRSTGEVTDRLRRLPLGSAQTFTVADSGGNAAVIECSPDGMEIIYPSEGHSFVCAVNRFGGKEMRAWQRPDAEDWRSEERYGTLVRTLGGRNGKMDAAAAKDLLAGKNGFLCQYDSSAGTDTVWSVVYDLKEKIIYRAEGNPGRENFNRDDRFSLR